MTMLQRVTKTAGFSGDAVVGRENVIDGWFLPSSFCHTLAEDVVTVSQAYHHKPATVVYLVLPARQLQEHSGVPGWRPRS